MKILSILTRVLRLHHENFDGIQIPNFSSKKKSKNETEVQSNLQSTQSSQQNLDKNSLKKSVCDEKLSEVDSFDVMLVVNIGDEQTKLIHATKSLLASISPVFKKHIANQSATRGLDNVPRYTIEQNCEYILVPKKFSRGSMQAIVEFSQGRDPVITEENVFNLREAARYYLIDSLFKIVEKFTLDMMRKEDSFCLVLRHACLYNENNLISKCIRTINTDLDQKRVFSSISFLKLEMELGLRIMLEQVLLKLDIAEVWECCQNWAAAQACPSSSLKSLWLIQAFEPLFSRDYERSLSLKIQRISLGGVEKIIEADNGDNLDSDHNTPLEQSKIKTPRWNFRYFSCFRCCKAHWFFQSQKTKRT